MNIWGCSLFFQKPKIRSNSTTQLISGQVRENFNSAGYCVAFLHSTGKLSVGVPGHFYIGEIEIYSMAQLYGIFLRSMFCLVFVVFGHKASCVSESTGIGRTELNGDERSLG